MLEYLEFVDDVARRAGQPGGGRAHPLDPGQRHRRRPAAPRLSESGGDLKAVVQCMIEETKAGLDEAKHRLLSFSPARATPSACASNIQAARARDRRSPTRRAATSPRAGRRDRGRRRAVRAVRARRRWRRGRSTALPDVVAEDMEQSAVSIFAAHAQANELGSRMQMTDIVNRRRMRHAHMVNITDQIMCEGMRADYPARRSPQPRGHRHRPPGPDHSRDDAGGHATSRADARSGTALGQDQRPDLARQVGQSARRRGLHDARRRQRHVRHRRRRRRLALRPVRHCSKDAADDRDRAQPARRRAVGQRARCATTSGATRTPTRTATASASSPSARTSG